MGVSVSVSVGVKVSVSVDKRVKERRLVGVS